MNAPRRIALLGAESTGKTRLAADLAAALQAQGQSTVVVPEVLREWCAREGRTPRHDEQHAIAQEQAQRVLRFDEVQVLSPVAARDSNRVVIADTTPLMTAIYSHLLFNDESLYDFALAHQRLYAFTLVTGLDLPWVADGLQRDGPQVREPVDILLRAALARAGVAYRVIYGHGPQRLQNALTAMEAMPADARRASGQWGLNTGRQAWSCDTCSDPVCEHRLFTGLLRS